ncbi:MAG: hypothetical protein J0H13_06160 [Thiomonas arsenitoxydans]|nr:hypothetical protein [Thiomonas arsenitoxydans]
MAFNWRASKTELSGRFSRRDGSDRVFRSRNEEGQSFEVRGDKRLPGLADIKLLYWLTQQAQRNGNKPLLFIKSRGFILSALGRTNCPYNIEDLEESFKYLSTMSVEYVGAHQPAKPSKYGVREAGRETVRTSYLVKEWGIDPVSKRVRVKLCDRWLQMNSSANRSQFAMLSMAVVRKLRTPAELNLYRYLCSFPHLHQGVRPHARTLDWWAHLCGFHDDPETVKGWKLRKKIEETVRAVAWAEGIDLTFTRGKCSGGLYRWELARRGAKGDAFEEVDDAVSPGVRLPASNDADVKPEPRQRVRLVA